MLEYYAVTSYPDEASNLLGTLVIAAFIEAFVTSALLRGV
jgi:hypothetical protein